MRLGIGIYGKGRDTVKGRIIITIRSRVEVKVVKGTGSIADGKAN